MFCQILWAIVGSLKTKSDRMNFALRHRLPVLTSGCFHPYSLERQPLLSTKARRVSSYSPSEDTHDIRSSFPPLPNILPEPPAHPCPHLTEFSALRPLYERHWRVGASYNNARDTRTVALEKKFTLKKYRHTLEFFNDVMGLEGICAQEKVYPSRITRISITNTPACLAPSNRCPVYIHDVDIHSEDLECHRCAISTRYPAFPRNNVEGRSLGCPHREAL